MHDTLTTAVDAVMSAGAPGRPAALSDDELTDRLASLGALRRACQALEAVLAAEVAARSMRGTGTAGLARRTGHRSPAGLVGTLTGDSERVAAGGIRLGRAISPGRDETTGQALPARFPRLGEALVTGRVAPALAHAVIGVLDELAERLTASRWTEIESEIAAWATTHSFAQTVRRAKQLRDTADEPGVARREEDRYLARRVTLIRDHDGWFTLSGRLDPESGVTLATAIESLTHPRNTATAPEGTAPDDRSWPQRAADALIDLAQRALAQGLPATGGVRPQIMVVVRHEEMATGRGRAHLLGSDEAFSAESARRIGCDAVLRRIVLGPAGEALDLGLAQRLFSQAQRTALAVRDGGCVGPRCDRPPGWAEAHHARHWAEGGPTSIDNAVLLCAFHHQEVHRGRLEVEMRPTAFGAAVPYIRSLDAHGRPGTWHRARSGHAPSLPGVSDDEVGA